MCHHSQRVDRAFLIHLESLSRHGACNLEDYVSNGTLSPPMLGTAESVSELMDGLIYAHGSLPAEATPELPYDKSFIHLYGDAEQDGLRALAFTTWNRMQNKSPDDRTDLERAIAYKRSAHACKHDKAQPAQVNELIGFLKEFNKTIEMYCGV